MTAADPLSYETSVEETGDGRFRVIVTTLWPTGARRDDVGTYGGRPKAELAASVIRRSAHRYQGSGNASPDAPTFADPERSR